MLQPHQSHGPACRGQPHAQRHQGRVRRRIAEVANVFIYNSATDTGYFLQDVYTDASHSFETGATLVGAGNASDFDATNSRA